MKKLLIFAAFLSVMQFANAKIWRVNNNENLSADYIDLYEAVTAASAGDTIYVEGSTIEYTGNPSQINIDKKLHIIGPGNFLDNYDDLTYRNIADVGFEITISSTAEGTIIEGISQSNRIYVNCDNVILRRNRLNTVYLGSGNDVKDVIIAQNYLNTIFISIGKKADASIHNNIFSNYLTQNGTGALSIINNTFYYTTTSTVVDCKGSYIANNIMKGTIKADATNIVENNLTSILDVDFPNYFNTTASKYNDRWMLSENSLAKGAGKDGVDCGAFGGNDPYILSGLPKTPQILDIVSTGSGTEANGLDVTVKINTAK